MAKKALPPFIQKMVDAKAAKEEKAEPKKGEKAEGAKGSPKEKATEAKEAKGKPFPGAAAPFGSKGKK